MPPLGGHVEYDADIDLRDDECAPRETPISAERNDMSISAERVLIIGGGFSGMSALSKLRKRGGEVDIVEIDPGWRSYGRI
jgi:NADPH-dependent 2,4-dienoyl-CoA reductase/sulfur reductase-like enzyme